MADLRSYFTARDLDTGAGTDLVLGVSLRLSASGGSIEALGQQVKASSIPVTIASDQGALTVDSELPAAAALADGSANPTTPLVGACNELFNGTTWDRVKSIVAALDSTGTGIQAVGVTGQFDDVSTATVTENQFAPVRISSRRALLVEGVASGTALSVTLSSNTVDTELPAAAALADGAANPTTPLVGACMIGYNGTTWDRIWSIAIAASYSASAKGLLMMGANSTTDFRAVSVNSSGRLQVDVISGAGSNTPTTPINTYVTSAALAAGSSANLDTGDLGAQHLSQVEVFSTVAFKAAVYTISNGVASANPIAIGGGPAFTPFTWKPPHINYAAVTSTAGIDGFRVAVTNLDDVNAADVYATFHTEV